MENKFLQIFNCGKYLEMLELSDANIRTDDGFNFDIHRVILAMSSDYFSSMFVRMGERRKFHIPGISGECLSDILCYVYTGDIKVTEINAKNLIMGADYLLLKDLQMKIKYHIKFNLTEVNCLRILHAAYQISDEDIFQECFRFIQTRFERIIRCQKDDLVDLPPDILERILSNRSLYVYNERTVWQAIVAWEQKDTPFRLSCVPQLLLTLAMEDTEEELATEILQHEIVSENCFMRDLIEIPSSNDLATNLDVFLTFFRSYSTRFTEPILRHRTPLQLYVAWSYNGDERNLYITYDENTDLWRKITELTLWPDVLIAIGHNIYIFNKRLRICMNFDLSAMNWVRMDNPNNLWMPHFYNELCIIVATDACIYTIIQYGNFWAVELYDTVNNRWCHSKSLNNISNIAAVAIENKIYVVGDSVSDRDADVRLMPTMMTQMFDPHTRHWSILSPPTIYHTMFSLVAHHQKIYLIGDSDAEVFDPVTNLWKELRGGSRKRSLPNAKVIDDQIIVTDEKGYYECWNNEEECFEEFIKNDTFDGLPKPFSRFCSINDAETISVITRQNRHPDTHMKKICW